MRFLPSELEQVHQEAEAYVASLNLQFAEKIDLLKASERLDDIYASVAVYGAQMTTHSKKQFVFTPVEGELDAEDRKWCENFDDQMFWLLDHPFSVVRGLYNGITIKRNEDLPPFKSKPGYVLGYVLSEKTDVSEDDDLGYVTYFSPVRSATVEVVSPREASILTTELLDEIDNTFLNRDVDFKKLARFYEFASLTEKQHLVRYLNRYDIGKIVSSVTVGIPFGDDYVYRGGEVTAKNWLLHHTIPVGRFSHFCSAPNIDALPILALATKSFDVESVILPCDNIEGYTAVYTS